MRCFLAALHGIARTVSAERNMRIHLCIAVLALLACLLLHVDAYGWSLILLCVGMVLAAELFNTALETLADRVSTDHDPLIGAAKDAAAGAVFVLAVISVIVGLIVYIPAIWRLCNG